MKLVFKLIEELIFVFCVVDIFAKYAWAVFSKRQKMYYNY